MTKLFRSLRSRYQSWKFYRAHPEIKTKIERIEAAKKAHRPTRQLRKELQRDLLEIMRGGV